MLEVEARLALAREVRASAADAYALLRDVQATVAHFPKVAALERGDDGAWTWRMDRVGAGRVSIQTVYAVRYAYFPEERRITWAPVAGVGNAAVSGSWQVEPAAGGARLLLDNACLVSFPLPRILRPLVQAFAARENRRLIEAFLDNLARTLEGGDGRLR